MATKRSVTWHARPYAPGDDERVVQLYEAVYGTTLSLAYYRWKLLDAPWSLGAPNVWVADAGDRLAGHYAATPLRFKGGDQVVTIGHTGDAMTHPDFRRQGVFTTVAQTAHEAWARAGVPFMVGVPNDQWVSRRAPLGYREQFRVVWFWRPLRLDKLLARRFRLPAFLLKMAAVAGRVWDSIRSLPLGKSEGVAVRAVSRPGPEFDTLWHRLQGHYPALYVRDRAWLTYRYAAAPDHGYQMLLARREGDPAGYLVYRLTGDPARRTGWIMDLFTAPDDETAPVALLRTALAAMAAAGAGTARVLLSPAIPLARTLRRAGFRHATGEFDASLVHLAQPLPDFSSPHIWFTITGDYDLI